MNIKSIDQHIDKIFYYSLISMFFSFGVNIFAYFFLYNTALLSLYIILRRAVLGRVYISHQFIIPILLFIYMAITPGSLLKDLHVAGISASAFFIGAACWLLLKKKLPTAFFLLPLALVFHFVVSGVHSLLFDAPFLGTSGNAGRLSLSFSHPNVLGEMAALGIFLLICFPNTRRELRYVGYGLIAALTSMIVLSVGRSVYLGMVATLLTAIFTQFRTKAIAISIALLALGYFCFPIMPQSEQVRITGMLGDPLNEPTFQSRRPIWTHAFQKFTEAPLFGQGLRNFPIHYGEYLKDNYETLKTLNSHAENKAFKHPHSIYLATLYGWGILGTLLLVVCWTMALRYGYKQHNPFMLYITTFTLAFGFFDVRLLSRDGALFLFFPMGLFFGHLIQPQNIAAVRGSQ